MSAVDGRRLPALEASWEIELPVHEPRMHSRTHVGFEGDLVIQAYISYVPRQHH
jgi:hypothetical protein